MITSRTWAAIGIWALLSSGVALGCRRSPQPEAPSAEPAPPAAKPAPAPVAAPTPAESPRTAPPPVPQAALSRGAELYGRMCAVCHGANGEGYKADNAPALAQQDFLASVSDDALGFAIAEGRPGTRMSAWFVGFGGPLDKRDVLAVIAFLRSWQKTPPAQLDARPASGDVARGKALYARKCERCHGDKGPDVRIRQRVFLAHNPIGFLRHALHTGRPPTAMQSFTQTLGDAGIEDVLAYLASLPSFPDPGTPPPDQRPPPLPLGPVPLNPKGPPPLDFRAYPAMTPVAVVHAQYARGARMVLLDARVPSDYMQMHIAGAVSVPFYAPEPYFAALPKDAWMVCYCGCPHAESGVLAEKLLAAGFKQVTVLDEGLGEWVDKGYPVHAGDQP
jgi:cytochrome c oxidase cbb3-type subunit 3/ubiquinol-cytochrome c reductase cytochrome c subunit